MRATPPWRVDARTRRWVLEDLVPLTPKEVKRIAPWRFDHVELMVDPKTGEWVSDYPTFYRCLNYDEDTRRCLIWEDRPNVCRDFPHYGPGGTVPPGINLPPRCAFRADIGEEVEEWQPVKIGRSR